MSRVITFFEAKDWEKEEYLRRLKERLGESVQDFEVKFVPYTLKKVAGSMATRKLRLFI